MFVNDITIKLYCYCFQHFCTWRITTMPCMTLTQTPGCIWWVSIRKFPLSTAAETKDTDDANVIASKEIDDWYLPALALFFSTSIFVPPRYQHFSQKHIEKLKTKLGRVVCSKVCLVYNNPNKTVQQTKTKGQPNTLLNGSLPKPHS